MNGTPMPRLLPALVVALALAAAPLSPARAASTAVVPIDFTSFTAADPVDAHSVELRAVLRNTNRYALTTWWDQVKNFDAQTGYLDLGGTGEHNVRPVAAQAYGLATSLALGVYQPHETAGISADTARQRTTRMIASVAYRHVVNRGAGGWGTAQAPVQGSGTGWQTAHWAAFAGFAGWLLWPHLGTADRENVRRMVEFEANRFNAYNPVNYRNDAGGYVTPGDSKSEEHAWNAQLLHVAIAMMPDHPNHATWSRKSAELMISAAARPADTTSSQVVNGRTVAAWVTGSNVNADGTITNHDRIHPDYMVAMPLSAHAGLTSSLAGRATPRAALFNLDRVYDALVDKEFVTGSRPYDDPRIGFAVASPGGTIYRDGGSSIYYPHPNDWGTGRRMHVAAMDAMADAFRFDGLASQKGAYWAPFHVRAALDLQRRHGDGRTYRDRCGPSNAEDKYLGCEEWVSHHAAWAYTARWIKHHGAFRVTDVAL